MTDWLRREREREMTEEAIATILFCAVLLIKYSDLDDAT